MARGTCWPAWRCSRRSSVSPAPRFRFTRREPAALSTRSRPTIRARRSTLLGSLGVALDVPRSSSAPRFPISTRHRRQVGPTRPAASSAVSLFRGASLPHRRFAHPDESEFRVRRQPAGWRPMCEHQLVAMATVGHEQSTPNASANNGGGLSGCVGLGSNSTRRESRDGHLAPDVATQASVVGHATGRRVGLDAHRR